MLRASPHVEWHIMSNPHFSSSTFPHERMIDSGDAAERPLPYRQAVPLIFGLSVVLWGLLWKLGSFALRLVMGG